MPARAAVVTWETAAAPHANDIAGVGALLPTGLAAGPITRPLTGREGILYWDGDSAVDLRDEAVGTILEGEDLTLFGLSADGTVTGAATSSAAPERFFTWHPQAGFVPSEPVASDLRIAVGLVGAPGVAYARAQRRSDQSFEILRWAVGTAPELLPRLAGPRVTLVAASDHMAAGIAEDADGYGHLVLWPDTGGLTDLGVIGSANIGDGAGTFTADGTLLVGSPYHGLLRWTPGAPAPQVVPVPGDLERLVVAGTDTAYAAECTRRDLGFCFGWRLLEVAPDGSTTVLLDSGSNPVSLSAADPDGRLVGTILDHDLRTYRGYLYDPACGLTVFDQPPDNTLSVRTLAGSWVGGHGGQAGKYAVRGHLGLEPCRPGPLAGRAPSGRPELQWAAADGRGAPVTSYRVQRDGVTVAEVGAGSLSWVDDSAEAGVHHYTVTAVNAIGESNPSDPVEIVAEPPPSGSPAPPAAGAPAAEAVLASPTLTG